MGLQLHILSPEGSLFEGEVEMVKLPGTLGQFEVLERHAPLISSLNQGEVIYRADGEVKSRHIAGGFAEIKENRVSVCVEL